MAGGSLELRSALDRDGLRPLEEAPVAQPAGSFARVDLGLRPLCGRFARRYPLLMRLGMNARALVMLVSALVAWDAARATTPVARATRPPPATLSPIGGMPGAFHAAGSLAAPPALPAAPALPKRPLAAPTAGLTRAAQALDAVRAEAAVAALAAPSLSAAIDASRSLFDRATPAMPAQAAAVVVEPPASEREIGTSPLWAKLERILAPLLGLDIPPGRTAFWAARTRDLLRNDPALPLFEALVQALAPRHDPARRVAISESGATIVEVPAAGETVLARNRHGLYAFTESKVYLRTGGEWRLVLAGRTLDVINVHVLDDRIILGDYDAAYEIIGERPILIAKSRRGAHAPVRHEGTLALPLGQDGLFERTPDGRWSRTTGYAWATRGMMAVYCAAVLGRDLYIGTSDGVFIKETGLLGGLRPWRRAFLKGHQVDTLIEHEGRLYAEYRLWGGSPTRDRVVIFDGKNMSITHEGNVNNLLKLNGRLYIQDGRALLEFDGRLWREFIADAALPNAIAFLRSGFFIHGGRLHVNGEGVLHVRDGSGWSPVLLPADGGTAVGRAALSGKDYLATTKGVYEAAVGGWRCVLRREGVSGIAVDDGRLLVATGSGVLRFAPHEGLPDGWPDAILREIGEDILRQRGDDAETVEAPRQEDGTVADRDGRPVFNGFHAPEPLRSEVAPSRN